jgi:hypothetical protein
LSRQPFSLSSNARQHFWRKKYRNCRLPDYRYMEYMYAINSWIPHMCFGRLVNSDHFVMTPPFRNSLNLPTTLRECGILGFCFTGWDLVFSNATKLTEKYCGNQEVFSHLQNI